MLKQLILSNFHHKTPEKLPKWAKITAILFNEPKPENQKREVRANIQIFNHDKAKMICKIEHLQDPKQG